MRKRRVDRPAQKETGKPYDFPPLRTITETTTVMQAIKIRQQTELSPFDFGLSKPVAVFCGNAVSLRHRLKSASVYNVFSRLFATHAMTSFLSHAMAFLPMRIGLGKSAS